MSLDYKEVRRRDRHGNSFRYQATVTGGDNRVTRRLAYDVFLVSGR
jgi:1,2-phenylacetyl-CoA epoxidase PaaB subunit